MDTASESYNLFLAEVRALLRKPEANGAATAAQRLLGDERAAALTQVYRAKLKTLVRSAIPSIEGPSGLSVVRANFSFRARVAATLPMPMLADLGQEWTPYVPDAPRTPRSMRNRLWEGIHDSAIHGLAEVGMTHRPSSDGLPRKGRRRR